MDGGDTVETAYKAARSMSLRIPEDISVFGHNDFDFSSLLTPPLTTIRVPIHELGMISASKLFSMIKSEKKEGNQMLPTKIQYRSSVANLKQQ